MRVFIKIILLMFVLTGLSMATPHKKAHHPVRHKAVAHNKKPPRKAVTETIKPTMLEGYADYPTELKELIEKSMSLSERRLNYLFGSSNPKNGGLDCSGTIYYLLNGSRNQEIPRQASELYRWVENSGNLHTVSSNNLSSSDFKKLKPGDLLFWSGTYPTRHQPSITHVMLYLGRDKEDKPLMFGASSAGTFDGKRIRGVSVFDFRLPKGTGKARFVGYGCIPNLTC